MKNRTDNPMQPEILANAPRCGAKTRSGSPCRSPAVKGRRRCRMHGGTNRGAPKGNQNAWLHGNRSAEAEMQLKELSQANRDLRLSRKLREGRHLTAKELDRVLDEYLRTKAP
ncbi:HGGxSTG domain-containing protein [Qipengyuania flava]|uniref:HGGxSTG domain-containing protein n=1 Tax=Qipengyuania flava TaxID=192812 RepID=UPI003C7C5597